MFMLAIVRYPDIPGTHENGTPGPMGSPSGPMQNGHAINNQCIPLRPQCRTWLDLAP